MWLGCLDDEEEDEDAVEEDDGEENDEGETAGVGTRD
jgi:hypothetical protein